MLGMVGLQRQCGEQQAVLRDGHFFYEATISIVFGTEQLTNAQRRFQMKRHVARYVADKRCAAALASGAERWGTICHACSRETACTAMPPTC